MKTLVLLSWFFKCSILLFSFNKHEVLGQSCVVSGQCLDDQRDLLLQLKSSLTIKVNVTEKLVHWDQSLDCCSWDGVTCDVTGHVIGLNLSGQSVSGRLENSSLFNLRHLKSLDLSYNYFSSVVPENIGNLTNLTYLNLSNAGFGGQVPEEMSHLSNLVTLDLSILPYLQISSLELQNPNFSILVQNLNKLEELYLDGVNISAHGSEWGQVLSSSLPRLRVLSMTNCYLSGPIDSSLMKLQSLSVIRLDNNNISSPVPGFFSRFSNLTSLRLSSCGLEGEFPREIFLVPTLQVMDIANNQLLQGSLPEFQSNSALQRLVLTSTNFSGKLPLSIGNLQSLSILHLSNCQFSGTLPNSMAQLSRLVSVDLSTNKFSGPIPSFQKSKNLTEVVLSHNSLTGAISSVHWEGLNKLAVIDLRNNLLNGSVPSSLFELPSLEQLQLYNNQFEGQLPEFQHASSSLLEILDLSSNKLEGPIPMSIFSLNKLNILVLSSNNFSGSVQLGNIQRLQNLTSLDLSYNSLSFVNGDSWSSLKLRTLKLASCKLEKFPNLKNHPKLVTLDLSKNEIHGEVPNWIWELGSGFLSHLNLSSNNLVSLQEPYTIPKYLSVLDLHLNQISGSIPVLPQFIYVDLSSNNFNSSIPTNFVKTNSFALFLSLSNNNLTGVVPKCICNVSSIQVLDLSNNRLSGSIPACMPAMTQTAVVLNLQRNRFTGKIPDSFSRSCGLKTLDLNKNSLEGHIPKSLVNCSDLEVLNLGNNNLSGEFPCMLKSISTLKVLVLRSNNFSGRIGCPQTSGTWQMLQILDLAHNNFDGELPGDCLHRWEAMRDDQDNATSDSNHIRFEILKFSTLSYQDAVTVTLKGLEMKFVKILTVFTSMDLSCNKLVGQIPEEVGLLKALYVLNLSHNALTGQIPPSIGELQQLESLDLSQNSLNGSIPTSLGSLHFLSFLNLSFNQLVGQIPAGNQIQTFSEDSFSGNAGLCGFPLKVNCTAPNTKLPDAKPNLWSKVDIDWQSIYSGIGFGVGAGAVVALLLLWRKGTYWLEDTIDNILMVVLPMIGFSYKTRDQWDDEDFSVEEEDSNEIEMEDIQSQGQFCVFCSKLDVTRKRAIHDPTCSCHSSPTMSSTSSYSSSSSSL